ncbi:WD40-repeat-containing domain protein, partial [Rhodocollybia butyracea]
MASALPTKKARLNETGFKSHHKPSIKGKEKATSLASSSKATSLPITFKVVAGSYERLLYGLEGSTFIQNDKVSFILKPIFIFPAHVSPIKAVATSPGGKWLATGSADEIVKVWDLKRRKEIGGLMHHEGSVTTLAFPSRSHLVSASEDGTIGIFHARDWSVLRTLRGHKGRINCVDVHPSGKVALSVGKDSMLRMWDMMRGRGVASVKLGKEGEIVRWSTGGEMFAVQSGKDIDIYSTDMSLLHSINHPSRLHDIKFCKPVRREREVLFAAAEDKKVSVYDLLPKGAKPNLIAQIVGHENRIKALQTLDISLPSSGSSPTSTTILSTVSSDGNIHIYDLAELEIAEQKEILPVATYDTKGTRLTCVALGEGELTSELGGKRKRERENGEEEEEEWGGIGEEGGGEYF